jgi:chromosome segregation ATPase
LLAQNAKSESDRKEWLDQLHELENAKERVEIDLQKYQKQTENLNARIKYLETYKEKYDNQATNLRETEEQRRELQTHARRLERDHANLLAETQRQTKTIADNRTNIENLLQTERQYNALLLQTENVKKQLDELTTKLHQTENVKKQLTEQLQDKNTQLTGLEIANTESEGFKQRYQTLLPQYEKNQHELDLLRNQYTALLEKNQYLETLTTELRNLNRDYKKAVDLLEQRRGNPLS